MPAMSGMFSGKCFVLSRKIDQCGGMAVVCVERLFCRCVRCVSERECTEVHPVGRKICVVQYVLRLGILLLRVMVRITDQRGWCFSSVVLPFVLGVVKQRERGFTEIKSEKNKLVQQKQ